MTIETEADVARGLAALSALDPTLAPLVEMALEEGLPLRRRPPGFAGLAGIVVAQMVSKASAAAIHGRLVERIRPLKPATYLAADEETLAGIGLSRAKRRTLEAVAHAALDGLDLEALAHRPEGEAIAALAALPGIGRWTAEVYLLSCGGHEDVFPAGDLALQAAVGDVAGLDARPSERETRGHAERWSPHRAVAARLMWWHYARLIGRDAAPG